MRSLTTFKLGSAALTFGVAWAGVFAPYALAHRRASDALLSLASALSAGVMLGAGLLHLLPDAAEDVGAALGGAEYPCGHLLFALGLLAPLAVALIWGINVPVMKAGLAELDPFLFNAARLSLSALSLGLFSLREPRGGGPTAPGGGCPPPGRR